MMPWAFEKLSIIPSGANEERVRCHQAPVDFFFEKLLLTIFLEIVHILVMIFYASRTEDFGC